MRELSDACKRNGKKFEVRVKYTTGSKENSGSYEVNIGEQTLRGVVQPTPNENESSVITLGRVKLGPGKQEIAVKPTEIKGGELMRLFYLELTPVNAK